MPRQRENTGRPRSRPRRSSSRGRPRGRGGRPHPTASQRLERRQNLQEQRRANRRQLQDQRRDPVSEFVPQAYFLRLQQTIQARRTHDKLPKTFCSARLFLKDGEVETHNVGTMDKLCRHCAAKLYSRELKDGASYICCHKGKIRLEPIIVCD